MSKTKSLLQEVQEDHRKAHNHQVRARPKRKKATLKRKVLNVTAVTFLVALAMLTLVLKAALWSNHKHFVVQSPITTRPILLVFAQEDAEEATEKAVETDPTLACEWSQECVESYITAIAGEDQTFLAWALFTANWEGGYTSQDRQVNMEDVHTSGKVGSFGQFQFGEDTYNDWCEKSPNWKSNWRAQARCAKVIWDAGHAKDTWWNTTNKWLAEHGL